jgi:hypothetical protein
VGAKPHPGGIADKPCANCGNETRHDPFRRRTPDGRYLCDACQMEEWDRNLQFRLRLRRWSLRGLMALCILAVGAMAMVGGKVASDSMLQKRAVPGRK